MILYNFDWMGNWNKMTTHEIVDSKIVEKGNLEYMLVKIQDSFGRTKIKEYLLPIDEGVVRNRKFWLSDRNNEKANDIFRRYKKKDPVHRMCGNGIAD